MTGIKGSFGFMCGGWDDVEFAGWLRVYFIFLRQTCGLVVETGGRETEGMGVLENARTSA